MTPTRAISLLAGVAVLLLVAIDVAGCGNSGSTASSSTPKKAKARPPGIDVATDRRLGKILVNSSGSTLYLFKSDRGTRSACSGACAAAWPPLRVKVGSKPTVAGGAQASKVATAPRPDGTRQVTYNGHPLYLYQEDDRPGVVNGQGVNVWGGRWFVLSPAGKQISTKVPGAGGGY